MFGELIESYIQTRERNNPTKIETLQQEISELTQHLEKSNQLETEINSLKLEKSQLNQQNTQLLTEKRAIEQEQEHLKSQIDQQTQTNRELSAQNAQPSTEPVQPIHTTPASQPNTAPTLAPVPKDLAQVLEGLQTLSAALQQWQGQSAPGVPATVNSPSIVLPQSEPPTAPVETSPIPSAITRPALQSAAKESYRSPIAYNFLE